MPTYSRTGSEITLNTQVAGNQSRPSVAGFAGGGFVTAWVTNDATQDGSGTAIKVQLYDAAGVAVGGEVLVNSAAAVNQLQPSVTTLASGNFLVTWETTDTTQDGAGKAIKAQLFSGAGVAIGGEFRVNTQTVADQSNAVVTGLAGGGFVVAWQTADATQDGHSNAIKGQRYDASGVAVGGEFLINPTAVGYEANPHLAALASGGFLATWTLGQGTNADVYAQLFDAAGAKTGSAFRVNTVTALNQDYVCATQLADGRIVVTWKSSASLTTNDSDIKAQVFSASGVRIGSEFTVSTTRTDPDFGSFAGPTAPQVDDLPDGGFVITWTLGGLDNGIRGQFFDANAERVGGEVLINTAPDRTEADGDVAVDGLGRLFAVWNSSAMTSPFDANIRGQFFTSAPGVTIASNGGGDLAAVSVVENTSAVTTVTASGGPGIVYAIVAGFDATRFTIDATSGALAFVSPRNFEVRNDSNGNNIYRVVVTATSGTQVDVQQLTVTVTNVNEAPSFTGSGATLISYHEDWTDPAVATVAAADPDGDTLSYSLTGTDAGYFTISAAGVLAFAAPADYEAVVNAGGDHYLDVTVVASDGTFAISRALTIDLFDQNEGPVITAYGGGGTAALTIAENVEAVGYIGVIDPDWLDDVDIGTIPPDRIFDWIVSADYEFTLSGPDAALFGIQNPTGYLYFLGGRDFEAPSDADGDGVYEVTVTVSDGFAPTDSQALSITVVQANEAPVITSNGGGLFAAVVLSENTPLVTTVTSSDLEGGVSYSIAGGADAALFAIDATTGVLSFLTAPDFEAPTDTGGNNVYNVIVRAGDGSLSDLQSIAVTVTDVNEAPVIVSNGGGTAAAVTVSENDAAVTAVLADGGVTYSIAGGADAALFALDASTGALSFIAGPDFEAPGDADANGVYEVVVSASDGSLSDTQALSITVVDVDEAPSFVSPTEWWLNENEEFIGVLQAHDPEGGGMTYFVAGGADGHLFLVMPATGEFGLVPSPDFELPTDADGDNVYEVEIGVADDNHVVTTTVRVTVNDVFDTIYSFVVDENDAAAATLDIVGGGTGYNIVSGTDAAFFTLDPSGVLTFNAAPDFEAPADSDGDNVYEFEVEAATPDGDTVTATVTVAVEDVDEAPNVFGSNYRAVYENGTFVGVISALDPEGAMPITTIVGGADGDLFQLDRLNGELSFLAAPDFEAPADADGDNVYEVTVEVSDGGLSSVVSLEIAVADVAETLTFAQAAFAGQENGLAVATLSASGNPATTAYAITGGADAALFALDVASGALRFLAAPDFEAPADADGDNVYEVTVSATDGTSSGAQTIAVAIGNVDEDPSITSAPAVSVVENETAVAIVTATDPEGAGLEFRIAGGADAALFALDAATGALRFLVAPDFEAPRDADGDNLYEVVVSAGDGSLGATQTLTVSVLDVPGPAVDGTAAGNNLAGGAEEDTLRGMAGNDKLSGLDGDDTLEGGEGADRLTGGAGDDTMAGGAGDDTYYVDTAGDLVVELAGEGFDVVRAQVDYALTDNVEELFVGGAARNGTGNALGNTLHGSGSNNALLGLAGDDVIRGLGGRDTIDGGEGEDLLDGGVGKDTLTGGAGRDAFQFRDGDFGTTRALADVITDFSQADREKIQLNLVDANTALGGDQAFAWIGTGAFTGAAGQLRYVHQAGNTYVEGDTDGDGTLDFAIMLTGAVTLTSADFTL